ncbi:MAG: hypothetical protein HQK52_23685 [Oligoflexia bacterium]|nr:hypothetical protein [Oligoflexia bacterium]
MAEAIKDTPLDLSKVMNKSYLGQLASVSMPSGEEGDLERVRASAGEMKSSRIPVARTQVAGADGEAADAVGIFADMDDEDLLRERGGGAADKGEFKINSIEKGGTRTLWEILSLRYKRQHHLWKQ